MTKKSKIDHYTDKEALDFHNRGKSGKIEIISSKSLTTKRDLSLAYSPGVAVPVKEISKNPDAAYEYTSKGNLVAVISNGSAILGLGDLGALASKPVMEGKAILFKRFADIDAIDIEIDSKNSDEIIKCIQNIGNSFGGINLEDIAAPDCFIIERKLRDTLDIPIFHDDQHGTAIITSAALINALDISNKKPGEVKVVVNGAGASALACANLFKSIGIKTQNIIMLDTKGVIYKGRDNVDQFKSAYANETKLRTLKDAINEAIRDWVTNVDNTHYLIGSAVGPHPYPEIVRDFQKVIGIESKDQIIQLIGRLPDYVVACVGGGSNAIGLFYEFIKDEEVNLIGVEAGGLGQEEGQHAATLTHGEIGVLHGSMSYLLQDEDGQVSPAHSISAGLDYPGVGPEHSYLKDAGRANYVSVTDHEAIEGFKLLTKTEGIIPALEPAHGIAYLSKFAPKLSSDSIVLFGLSGRGDKDIDTVSQFEPNS